MRRFRFNLEKALRLRQHSEQEAKAELGRAVGALAEIEGKIRLNALALAQSGRQRFSGIAAEEGGSGGGAAGGANCGAVVGASRGAAAGAFSMFAWNAYILRLEQEAQRLAEEAAKAELAVEEKRGLYIEASRELKMMEKLKEKRKIEYRKEMFAAEAREMDDRARSAAPHLS